MKLEIVINGIVAEEREVQELQLFGELTEEKWNAKRDHLAAHIEQLQNEYREIFLNMKSSVCIRVTIESRIHEVEISDEEMQEFENLTKHITL